MHIKSYLPKHDEPNSSIRKGVFPNDVWLVFPVLLLVGLGVVMVYSASSALAMKIYGTDYFFLKRQLVFVFLGGAALLTCRFVRLPLFQSFIYPLLGLSILLLIAVHFSGLGVKAGGAFRWIKVGSLTFQPVELARVVFIIYLAYSLNKKGNRVQDPSIGFTPHVIILFFFVGLIMAQPDFGSALIFFCIAWAMMFVGGVRFRYLGLSFGVMCLPVYFFLVNSPYRMRRLVSFWDPWKYMNDEGYQAVQSMLAFGVGGISGVGLGNGYQKLFYLPEPHTDFIFSVIGEEIGLLGVLGVVLCYLIILWKGIQISLKTEDRFASLLAFGLTFSIGIQVCINMGVALSLLPTKGLTLPFLSYGGTSLLINMACIGLLMNIGALQYREKSA